MSSVPRLALGAIQSGLDLQPMQWAVLDALDREGVRIQTYLSRACFASVDAATSITGVSPRHLDSWLMRPEQCRALFLRSARESDLAVLTGSFADIPGDIGGQLEPLCQWLGVPRLAVIDVSQLSNCVLPRRPARAAGLLLDKVTDDRDFVRWQTILEPLWGIPVLGGLESLCELRSAIAGLRPGESVSRDLCRTLGNHLLRHASAQRLLHLAAQGDFAIAEPSEAMCCAASECQLSGVRVAVAYDDVFHCYFPDALDALESRGAVVRDFSPLRDEALPLDTDLVVIGCGHPERYAHQLGQNHCLISDLRQHVCSGRRIYAEGGGLAYLCQSLALDDGEMAGMVGVFPAVARPNPQTGAPRPVEVPLACDSWLGTAGSVVRGYLNDSWQLETLGRMRTLGTSSDRQPSLVLRHQAVGSRLHLNLAAQPQLLNGFLRPCPAALAWAAT